LEKQRRIRENPLKYARQHAKQVEASASRKALRVLFWGNRVGKTEWGAMETARILLGEHDFIPPSDGWIFCPSFDEQKDTTQEKLLRYLPESRVVDRTWLRKGILKEIVVTDVTGERRKVTFKSYEQGREKAQGAGKGFVWFDEEPPKDIFDECSVREEAGGNLFIFMTMTPIKGMTWVYDEIYLNTKNPEIFVSTATWDDNPFLTDEQKRKMAGRLTASALKVRREGKFMRQVGLVAAWFNRNVHVVEMGDVPNGELYFGIDFGFSNPCAGLWVAVDAEENVWVFDGFYRKGMTNMEIMGEMSRHEKAVGLAGRVDRIADSAQASDIKEMNDAGIRIVGVKKETGTKRENWDEWRAKLMEDLGRQEEDEDGNLKSPKIFISSALSAEDDEGNEFNFLVRELENLRWEEQKTDMGIAPKSVWGRQPNHAIDALTYVLATIEQNRKRGTGKRLRTAGPEAVIGADTRPEAKEIIKALMAANQPQRDIWQDRD
jgi:phage terminase large subunit-like protein